MTKAEGNRACPKCRHWRMYALANFHEDDINDSPAHDGWGEPSWFHSINWLYYFGWLVNIFRGAAGVQNKRAKLRKLRAEVLPRAPKTLVCPQCFEVIERF
jgi:hypothetical protein